MTDHEIRSSDQLEPTSGRGHTPWAAVAAVSIGVLVAGLAGYAVGRGTAEPPGPAAAPITLTTGAPNSTTEGSRSASDAMPYYGYGRVVFDSRGLSDQPGRTTAYAYDPHQVFSRQTAAAAADVLGVDGAPTSADGTWVVGPGDGSGRSLQLAPDGWATLSFYDPSLEPYGCAVAESGGSTGEGRTDEPKPDDPGSICETPEPDPGRDAAAVERTRSLLADLGVDVAGVELEAGAYGGSDAAFVTGFDVVDGQRTGATWSVVWVGRQVQSFYGPLAPLVSLGSYDVVGAETAVARLADPRFGTGTYGGPYPLDSYGGPYPLAVGSEGGQPRAGDATNGSSGDTATTGPTTSATLPPSVQPGSRFAWPVQQVTITKARLGLALSWQPDGSQVLLPTFELTDDDGGMWAVVAVSDDGLDFAAG